VRPSRQCIIPTRPTARRQRSAVPRTQTRSRPRCSPSSTRGTRRRPSRPRLCSSSKRRLVRSGSPPSMPPLSCSWQRRSARPRRMHLRRRALPRRRTCGPQLRRHTPPPEEMLSSTRWPPAIYLIEQVARRCPREPPIRSRTSSQHRARFNRKGTMGRPAPGHAPRQSRPHPLRKPRVARGSAAASGTVARAQLALARTHTSPALVPR